MPYDISIKKVAVSGAAGNLGQAIVKELLKSGLFDVTILTRENSTHTFPPEVKVCKVDYTNFETLEAALQGQDALVSAVSTSAVPTQRLLIDAAVKAGVKRIIPSEFGCDLKNANNRALPVYAGKVEIEQHLNELAEKGLISYTLVYTGPYLDWGLRNGAFFNFKERTANIYDGGDQLISVSRISTAGKAVRRILTHPRETADRAVWIKDIDISQNQLVKLAQALTPGEEWKLNPVNTADVLKKSLAEIESKNVGPTTMLGLIQRATYSPEHGNHFVNVHNSTLGISGITGPDLEELIASIFGRGG